MSESQSRFATLRSTCESMRKYFPDIVLILVLAGIITVHFTVGFSRLYYIARDRFVSSPEAGQVDEPAAEAGAKGTTCFEGMVYDRERVEESLECWTPFVDPADGITASDRPWGHRLSLVLFAVLAPLFLGAAVILNRRGIVSWYRERRVSWFDRGLERREVYAFAAVMAVALFARVFKLGTWVVEESEWGAVERLPLMDLMFHGREVMHEPPLFTTLQHFVYMINDTSLAWTRSLTCLTGVLLVMAVWRSSRMIFGPRTALLASALVAVHPFMVSNSHVMRPYSLASFFMVMLLPHAWRLASGGRRRDVAALAVFGGLAIWTHYTTLVGLLVLFLWMAVAALRIPEGRVGRLKAIAVAAAVLAVFFLPFMPYFFSDFSGKQGSGIYPGFVEDMVAAISGLPLGAGWIAIAFPIVTGLRRARSGRFLMTLFGGMTCVMALTVWMIWWEPTHMALMAPLLMMMIAAAAVRLRPSASFAIVAPFVLSMAVMTGVLFSLPSTSSLVWDAARPMTWHGMSYELQAQKVVDVMREDRSATQCVDFYATPVDQVSSFMYYWGPVTPRQIGMEPIEPNNFKTFKMDVDLGERNVTMRLHPIERLWSWEKGQWLDLEKALRERGCLWYHKSYQNCGTGAGRFFSSNDCAWLADNCEAVVSMPDGEMYLCRRERPVGPVSSAIQWSD